MKKTNKTGYKFIVFLVLISLIGLFVTCDDQGGGTSSSSNPSNPSGPSSPSNPSNPFEPLPDNSYRVIYDKNAADATGTMANSIFTNSSNQRLLINNFIRDGYCFIGWAKTATSATAEYTDGASIVNLTTAGNTIMLYAVWHEGFTVEVTEGSTLEEKFSWITNNVESYTTCVIEINSSESLVGTTSLSYSPKRYVTIHLKGDGSIIGDSYSGYGNYLSIGNSVTLILDGNLVISINIYLSSNNSKLIMNGGKIYGINSGHFGGGVSVNYGIFIMNGGEISGNTNWYGGGVCVGNRDEYGGTFIMNGGKIYGNTSNNGGGVLVFFENNGGGTFIMNGGEIYGNTSSVNGGGGVSVGFRDQWGSGGTFTMNGGEIYGNNTTSSRGGGGVYVSDNATFNKTGGTITGSNAANSNLVKNGSDVINNMGRAVYVGGSSFEKRKETTAGPGDNLSFKYIDGKPTWSGAWDY
jgi:hypothetical protein